MGLFIGLDYRALKGTSESKTGRKMTLQEPFFYTLHSQQRLSTSDCHVASEHLLHAVPAMNNSTCCFEDFANMSVSHGQQATGINKA